MKLKLLTAGVLAGLSGQTMAHVEYHDLNATPTVTGLSYTRDGWIRGTNTPTNPPAAGDTSAFLGDSHEMQFFKFHLASANTVTIEFVADAGAALDPAFSVYRGLLADKGHDNTIEDPLNAEDPVTGEPIPHPKDSAYWNSANIRDGQFDAFGKWSMASEPADGGNWAEVTYVAHKNDNTGEAVGAKETLTLPNLPAGDYTIAAAGALVTSSTTLRGGTMKLTIGVPATPPPTPTPTPPPTPTPTPPPTPTPTPPPTVAPTPTPTAAPTATPTAAPTATPTAAPTATPTASPSPTPSASPAPSASPSPSPSASPDPSASPAPSASPEPSASPSPTPGPTDSPAMEVTGGGEDLKVGDSVHFVVKTTDPQGQPVDVSAMLDNEDVAEMPGDLTEVLNDALAGTNGEAALAASVEAVPTTPPAESTTDDGSQCKIGHAVPVLVTDTLGNAMFKWVPTKDDAGEHVVVFKATDPDGNSTEESITFTVKALPQENRAPHFDWTSGWFGVNPGKQLKIRLLAMDPDGDDVRFFIQKGPEGAEIKNTFFNKKSGKWEATWVYTPDRDEAGNTYKVYFTATDDKPGEAKQTTRFTYVHVNVPKHKHKDDDHSGKGKGDKKDKD